MWGDFSLNLRSEISLGAIYIGTIIGAGFASGQEIISFFTIYGIYGLLGIAVASIFFFLLGNIILRQSIQKKSQCLRDILLPLAGGKLMFIFDLMMDIFCLTGYYIMLSGCGAVLEESFNLNYMTVIVSLSSILVWCLSKEFTGIAEFNKLLVSMILVLTIIIGFACLQDWKGNSGIYVRHHKGNWLVASVLYVSYNITLALAVLSSLGTYTNEAGAALGASAIGALGIFLMGALMWFITWTNLPSLYEVQVPLLRVARRHGYFLFLSSVIVLLSSMITTALGLGFSFVKSLSRRFGFNYKRAVYFLFFGIPLTKYSFAGLINGIYPLMGKLSIFFAILLAIRKVFKFANRMI